MKNLILIISVLTIGPVFIYSQPCLPEGITFTTQEQIDNFQTNYPGCTEIEGDVMISSLSEVTNLNGLSVITNIGGNLTIGHNYLLSSLTGLEGLTYIGGSLNIGYCVSQGLVRGNPSLTSLSGMNSLTLIAGDFYIWGDNQLADLSGLNSLQSIGGGLYIGAWCGGSGGGYVGNQTLTSLIGLYNLTYIGEGLCIEYNPALTSFTGVENLTYFDGTLVISVNASLTNLSGLENLVGITGSLIITYNPSLFSLSGLEGLTFIGGYLAIEHNNELNCLSGLGNIASGSITNLYILENTSLSTCEVKSICDYLVNPNGTLEISGNATGCNSPEEVQTACLTTVKKIETGNGITIIPNPSNEKITISLSSITGTTKLSIFNVSGEKVLERQLTNTETQIDISALTRGVYFVRVQNEKIVEVGKLIKN